MANGMKTGELAEIALRAGEILLVSGAEIYRVEETITNIFSSYGAECECFVLLSGIFVSVRDKDSENAISLIKHINEYSYDLRRIEQVNAFSRELKVKKMTYEESKRLLEDIAGTPRFSLAVRLLAAGAMSFVYSILFNGSIFDGIAAFLISLSVYRVKQKINEMGFFQFLEYFISGLLVGGLSLLAVKLFPELDIYNIIIGAIMILVPGVAITNGIKDALYGDTVSSLYRMAEAVFISIAVGSGVGIILTLA